MRKTKTFQIEGNDFQFEVRELTVAEIISLLQQDVVGSADLSKLQDMFSETLLPLCTNVKMSQLITMAPSDIKEVWDNFVEVNKVFFDAARNAGLADILTNLKSSLIGDFSRLLASLRKQDTTMS